MQSFYWILKWYGWYLQKYSNITQSYFAVQKNIRLNYTQYFTMKIPNKRKLQQIALNHSSDVDFQEFMNLYDKCNAKPYSFFSYWCYLASDNPSQQH